MSLSVDVFDKNFGRAPTTLFYFWASRYYLQTSKQKTRNLEQIYIFKVPKQRSLTQNEVNFTLLGPFESGVQVKIITSSPKLKFAQNWNLDSFSRKIALRIIWKIPYGSSILGFGGRNFYCELKISHILFTPKGMNQPLISSDFWKFQEPRSRTQSLNILDPQKTQ